MQSQDPSALPHPGPRPRELPYLLGQAFHRLAYVEWGPPEAPVLVCVHGLTRNGRDFDPLAAALCGEWRVVCPDLPGRGRSDFLPDPMLYQLPTYLQALSHLLAAIGRPVAWLGTSLGGLCGMALAAMPGAPITRLVLNDVGPFLPRAALARIGTYLGAAPEFPDLAALEAHLRQVHAPFGRLTDAEWRHLAEISARPAAGGRLRLHYDPAIAVPIRATPPQDVELWPLWEQIRIPVLTIRGRDSDLLLPETLARMAARSAVLEVPDAGHAPALMDRPTIEAVARFLRGQDPAS